MAFLLIGEVPERLAVLFEGLEGAEPDQDGLGEDGARFADNDGIGAVCVLEEGNREGTGPDAETGVHISSV